MNLEYGTPYYQKTIDQCRAIGARGGRRAARNRRLRQASQARETRAITEPDQETTAAAIASIDRLCPWLAGAERGAGHAQACRRRVG
jgi:hypothetical protein